MVRPMLAVITWSKGNSLPDAMTESIMQNPKTAVHMFSGLVSNNSRVPSSSEIQYQYLIVLFGHGQVNRYRGIATGVMKAPSNMYLRPVRILHHVLQTGGMIRKFQPERISAG